MVEVNLPNRVSRTLSDSIVVNTRPSFNRVKQGFSSPQNLGAFFKYFKIDISNEKDLYIPIMYRNLFEILFISHEAERLRALKYVGASIEDNIVYIPLIFNDNNNVNARREVRRTSAAIINNTFSYQTGLKAIITSKDVEYNIGNGVIMDKYFNPLFVSGIKAEVQDYLEDGEKYKKILYNEFVIKVSPLVFSNKDMLSRYIINKMIPFYTNTSLIPAINMRSTWRTERCSKLPSIEVAYMDDLFYTPKRKLPEDISKDINDFLVDNLDEFDEFLK